MEPKDMEEMQQQQAKGYGGALAGACINAAKSRQGPMQESESRAIHFRSEAASLEKAAEFYRAHPEFDEFVRLMREGVISLY